jgi:tetratricopeptide (TPR) repeat protein
LHLSVTAEMLATCLTRIRLNRGAALNRILAIVTTSSLALTLSLHAQEFEINGGKTPAQPNRAAGKRVPSTTPSGEIGWGSSIEVGRFARAAQSALAKGNYASAADYAQRGVEAAPQDARLWFLLGYASRLAGRAQTSLDAYQHGLRLTPGSVEGLSGLAQTYMRMGRSDDAKRILLQIINANPKRATDLMMAGELFLQSGDYGQAIGLLQRAETLQPTSHSEVLLAQAYMHNKQPDMAKAMLDRAKRTSPRNPDVFRAVAGYYREQRDYQNAIASLKQVPNKTPDVFAELGYTYALAGMKNESAESYVKAANAAPGNITMQLGAASALVSTADIPEAQKYLQRSESIDPKNYRLHAIRADIARIEHRTGDAITEYNAALANLPESVPDGPLYPIQLRLNLSEQYRDAQNQAEAAQQLQIAQNEINQLQVTGPTRAEFLRLRASLETAGNNFQGAENDLQEARRIDPGNINIVIQYASLLWRMKRGGEARALYADALKQDPKNRYALESLGYLAREQGDNVTAEDFFKQLEAAYPNEYVAYVALGDLYTAERKFDQAQLNYERGYEFAPNNALIVAGGANAAIEAHQIPLAGKWLERAKGNLSDDPRVMIERERYLFHTGKYSESAQVGYKAIQQLPTNRDANVYLAYDLYNLGRYDDVLRLVREKSLLLPKEPNFPLLAGHVQKRSDLLNEAVDDYTQALTLDPKMVEAYINRGYVLNDLQNAEQAERDFDYVLKLQPNNGVAHLGLSFSYLELRKGKLALNEADAAQKLLGESGSTHLARATAYRQMRLLADAEKEYRAALKFSPDNLTLHLALADTLYHLRRYDDSIVALNDSLRLSPDDPFIYAQMADSYSHLRRREDTLKYVRLAERQGTDQSSILLSTGSALMTIGDENAAMQRFERALDAPDAERVDARLQIARLFGRQGKWNDARQQISIAFAESRIGEAEPITTDNLIEAANLFLSMHDFDLAERYFERARAAGAADQVIAIGLANTYLAKGNPQIAQTQLASLASSPDFQSDYDYTLAMANVYRQEHDERRALGMFARANTLAGDDDAAERGLQDMARVEGVRINDKVSAGTDFEVSPIFQDATIYTLNARLFGNLSVPASLPEPNSSIQTEWTSLYRVHQNGVPPISGYFQLRNARGSFVFPGIGQISNRNTFDYNFNGALNPKLHIGNTLFQFNTGLQATIRRDADSPVELNQNLFRQFVFVNSSPIGNWLTLRGALIHEAGPFTLQDLKSKEYVGAVEFTVGRPWGRNALITGYTARDLQFTGTSKFAQFREFFTTSSYFGIRRQMSEKLQMTLLGEYQRAWQVQGVSWVNAQMMRPAVQLEYKINKSWSVAANGAFSRGQGFHVYDNVQSGVLISYMKPIRRRMNDGAGDLPVEYPLQFSFGVQQDDFYNFTGRGQAMFRPVVRLTLF